MIFSIIRMKCVKSIQKRPLVISAYGIHWLCYLDGLSRYRTGWKHYFFWIPQILPQHCKYEVQETKHLNGQNVTLLTHMKVLYLGILFNLKLVFRAAKFTVKSSLNFSGIYSNKVTTGRNSLMAFSMQTSIAYLSWQYLIHWWNVIYFPGFLNNIWENRTPVIPYSNSSLHPYT